MKKIFILTAILAASLIMTSCNTFYDFDDPYYSLPEASTETLQTTMYTPEQLAERSKRLAEINKMPYPEYTLDFGDEFEIRVYNQPEMHTTTAVTPDGLISMPFIDDKLHVAGLTIPEATKKIEEALGDYIITPKVSLIPLNLKSQTASISGAVNRGGSYAVTKNTRLFDMYAMAEGGATRFINGKTLDNWDFAHSTITRNGELLPIDFALAIEQQDPDNNIQIFKGDRIFIASRAEKMVNITGEVAAPQFQMWNPTLGLLQAVSNCGGLKDQSNGTAIIIRGGMDNPQYFKADAKKIFEGRKLDVLLQPGDTVYFPKDSLSVWNVYISKLMPTGAFINMLITPFFWYNSFKNN
ncbi:MAG: polysaccharide biosynthesis/export family protein [Victivallales bacterium]|nr:polysaccharide biosynthesis/export family protein [Victivallales bacterium]